MKFYAMSKKAKKFSLGKYITAHVLVIGGSLGCVVLLCGTGVVLAENAYATRFIPGAHIGDIDVSGLTYTQALDKIQPKLLDLQHTGLRFAFIGEEKKELTVPATIVPVDPGIGDKSIFSVDPDATVETAFSLGRTGNLVHRLGEQVSALLTNPNIPIDYTLDDAELEVQLRETFSAVEQAPKNAHLSFADGKWSVVAAESGQTIDYAELISQAHERFAQASTDPIQFDLHTTSPTITDAQAKAVTSQADALLGLAPLQVQVDDHSYEVGRDEFAGWLDAAAAGVGLNPDSVAATLDRWGAEVNQPAHEGRFRFVDGQLEQYEDSQTGKVIDDAVSVGMLQQQIVIEKKSEVSVYVKEDQPAITPENIADLGIKELLGTGHSNMGNSPYNRRLNIARGAELLNGLLIAPDQEFSVLAPLRPFTIENGYYPELVIKENKTLPEIGGGLCQIGTTTFRAAMMTGVPILERRNHSYAVSYYFDDVNHEPGTDATIYDPAPDLRFKNDTGHWMLFETKIDGNDLYFSFYGTSDGRKGSFTAPQISGWVAPPPTKEVEDPSLAPGEEKCTEHAHPGTTASFDYIVAYADGTEKTETFTSVYKPWQAVCLVGPQTDTAAPSTDTTVDSDSAPTTDSENVAPAPTTEEPTTTAPETKKKKKK